MNPLNCFQFDVHEHVAHLVLSRPDALNTMSPMVWRELHGVLTQVRRSSEVRALVISSTGKHFCAGIALDTFDSGLSMDDQTPEGRAAMFESLTDMQATFNKIEQLRLPVIATIHGGCIGGAVDLVTACCIR